MSSKITIYLILLATLVLAGCQTQVDTIDTVQNSTQIDTFTVGAQQVDCVGAGPQKCLIVNGDLFYSSIEGFSFEPGYIYELRVQVIEREQVPADASAYRYVLDKVISKTPFIPQECVSWYDGCNTCTVVNGELSACTLRACAEQEAPKCLAYSDNYVPEDATLCPEERSQAVTKEYMPVLASDEAVYDNWRSACANEDVDWYYPADNEKSIAARN